MAALLVVSSVLQLTPAAAAPGDIFTIPAPVIGADPPAAKDIKAGDASVSTQTGALQYSYGIQVPPGRNGAAPELALSYSSQAPTYGGVASGWSLPIPLISEDHAQGRLRTRSPTVEAQQSDPKRDDRFVSSMAGGRPLIAITEPTGATSTVYQTYRAQNDSTWTRYERMLPAQPFRWRARLTDGRVMLFAETARIGNCVVNDQYAPLTSIVDSFNNEVSFQYGSELTGECRLMSITWGQNTTSGATLPSFARVDFEYTFPTSCNGVYPNSQTDYRSGTKIISGASKLWRITAIAYPPGSPATPVHTRQITLGYDATTESCNQDYAPVRQLTSIQESAWGTDSPLVNLPAITFEYNAPGVALVSPQGGSFGTPWGSAQQLQNLGWGYRRTDDRWPTVESMFADVDGDGLQDLLINTSGQTGQISSCTAEWRRNLGIGGNGQPAFATVGQPIALPRLKWRGVDPQPNGGASQAQLEYPNLEGCALNGQVTAFENSHVNGNACHDPANLFCGPSTDPANDDLFCFPGGTWCPPDPGFVQSGRFRTYLAYRWLDADSDGLTDLVAAVHGDFDYYDIERGNNLGFTGGEPSISGIPGVGQWPACPGTTSGPARCKKFGNCLIEQGARSCGGGLCVANWGVVLNCMAQQPSTGCANVIAKPAGGPTNAPGARPHREPYMRCEGLYPWFIYKNSGNGAFASTPIIKYQPVPLESSSGDSSFGGPVLASENHAVLDFDGDGWTDALVRDTDANGQGFYSWQLWLGDGTGGFSPTMYTFLTRLMNCTQSPCLSPGDNAISGIGGVWGQTTRSTAGLIDANGDGVQDHWLAIDAFGTSNVAFNVGQELQLFGGGSSPTGEIQTAQGVKPGNDVFVTVTAPLPLGNQPIDYGTTQARNRLFDVDHDGRLDVVVFSAAGTVPDVYYNVGGQFTATGRLFPGDVKGITRETNALPVGQINPPFSLGEARAWRLKADLMDLDGDGIPESTYFGTVGFQRGLPLSSQPPRLLRRVLNNHGATTTVTYTSMHDTTTVEQHPELTWPDQRPKASPRAQWVVKTLQGVDSIAVTDATTAYFYKNPRFGADEEGRYSFRGFEEVKATKPGPTGIANGSRVIQRYGYDIDLTGRLVATLVMPSAAEAANDVRTIDKTTWQRFTLFGGALSTYLATESIHHACANGQTEGTCTPQAAAGYTKTTNTITAIGSSIPGSPGSMMHQVTQSLLQAGLSNAEGDRRTDAEYRLHADATNYRLVTTAETKLHRVSGAFAIYAKESSTWEDTSLGDTSWRVPYEEAVWVDGIDANRVVTRRHFDLNTGNVVWIWKPQQWANNPSPLTNVVRTQLTYDSRKLFATTEVNELGHSVDYQFEYGTGTKLATIGPNVPGCAPSCPGGTALREEHRVKVDGLGRMIERYDVDGTFGTTFTLRKVETNSYVDAPAATVTHHSAIDYDFSTQAVRYTRDLTELDGRGRPVRTTIDPLGSAAVTTYRYNHDGSLAEVQVPDPTANDATRVSYLYTFDSLARPLTIRRPDSTTPANRSGVNISYAGLSQTSTEVVGIDGGQPAVTTTVNDSFGRLVRVDEKRTTSAWSTTTYAFGPDDNVRTIVDPDGVTTSLLHDFAGRRTQITRNSRIWTYGYDKNGNMISETTPCTGPTCQAAYTSTIGYDELNRPVHKALAPRAMSVADRNLFGAYEMWAYDGGANLVGRLKVWQTFDTTNASPYLSRRDFSYDGQGNLWNLSGGAAVADYDLSRGVSSYFNLAGQPFFKYYRDSTGLANCSNGTTSEHFFDNRGLPSEVKVDQCNGSGPSSSIRNTRNVAGLVTKRESVPGIGAITYAESNWTYDKLGRVTSQIANKGNQLVQVVRQDLLYNGNDDPKSMHHWLGASNHKHFNFGFDLRHQLTTVGETLQPNAFTATYTYGLGGRFATAVESAAALPNSDVKARNVTYVYSTTDPERLLRLRKTQTKNLAEYTYDDSGNQITSYLPDTKELWESVYDGDNELRRVTKKLNGIVQGSEEYWYGHDDMRYLTVKRNGAGTRTEAIWFAGDVEAHYDGVGAVTHAFSHVSMGTPVARAFRSGGSASVLEYQFHGLANNTIAAVDQLSGTVNASFTYAPFGEVIEATNDGGSANGLAAHRRRMNDKFVDEVSGLAYYGYRYYDMLSMAWTQSDPLFRFLPDAASTKPRRANLYTAHLNNPLRYIDPDGRLPFGMMPAGTEAIIKVAERQAEDKRIAAAENCASCRTSGNPWEKLAGSVLSDALMDSDRAATFPTQPKDGVKSFLHGFDVGRTKDLTPQGGHAGGGRNPEKNGAGDPGGGGGGDPGDGGRDGSELGDLGDVDPGVGGKRSKRKGHAPSTKCSGPNSGCRPGKTDGNARDPDNSKDRLCSDCFTKSQGRRPEGKDYE